MKRAIHDTSNIQTTRWVYNTLDGKCEEAVLLKMQVNKAVRCATDRPKGQMTLRADPNTATPPNLLFNSPKPNYLRDSLKLLIIITSHIQFCLLWITFEVTIRYGPCSCWCKSDWKEELGQKLDELSGTCRDGYQRVELKFKLHQWGEAR